MITDSGLTSKQHRVLIETNKRLNGEEAKSLENYSLEKILENMRKLYCDGTEVEAEARGRAFKSRFDY